MKLNPNFPSLDRTFLRLKILAILELSHYFSKKKTEPILLEFKDHLTRTKPQTKVKLMSKREKRPQKTEKNNDHLVLKTIYNRFKVSRN